LLKAERRECEKTLERSRQIEAEYQRQTLEKAQRAARETRSTLAFQVAPGDTAKAYQAHYQNVMQRTGGADLSRVDAMIAVRLRLTGHSQEDIAGALRQCAPAIRETPENRNWDDYAQRMARYAFSYAGDRQAATLEKYQEHWIRLEGREPARDHAHEQRHEITHDGPDLSL
jgi:hypothetical protein